MFRFTLAVGALALALSPAANAAPSSLDPNFSGDGKLLTAAGGAFQAEDAILDGTKVVMSGAARGSGQALLAVARVTDTGELDSTFAGDGIATAAVGATDVGDALGTAMATGVALTSDGRYVVAGWRRAGSGVARIVAARFNADGTLDDGGVADSTPTDSFGTAGVAISSAGDPGVDALGHDVAVGPDNSVAIAGEAYAGTRTQFVVVRLTAAGAASGVAFVDFGVTARARAIALTGTGALLAGAAGTTGAVAALTAAGALDNNFDADGKQTLPQALVDAHGIALDQSGRVLVSGTGSGESMAVARLTSTGAVDGNFSGDGVATINPGTSGGRADGVAVEPDGKIVIGGAARSGGSRGFAAARLTDAGAPDTTFSASGATVYLLGSASAPASSESTSSQGTGLLLDGSGRIVIPGWAQVTGSERHLAVIRLVGGTGGAATPTISVADASVTEGPAGSDATLTFTLTRTVSDSSASSVNVATSNGTATAGDDYIGIGSQLVNFTGNETTKTVSVTVHGDAVDEENETLTLTLSSPVNAQIADGSATGTILDDDAGTPNMLSIADASATEGNAGTTPLTFVVTRANPAGTSSVPWSTSTGSAGAGDFEAVAEGIVSFAAGETSKSAVVQVVGDTLDEADESFTVTLGPPTNATTLDGTATGTILDDDEPVSRNVSIGDTSVTEGGTATFTLTRPAGGAPATVSYATADGTAGAADYDAASGSVTFVGNDVQKTVTVQTKPDTADEPDETFKVLLTADVGATVIDGEGIGTITDDDAPPTVTPEPTVTPSPTPTPSSSPAPDVTAPAAALGGSSDKKTITVSGGKLTLKGPAYAEDCTVVVRAESVTGVPSLARAAAAKKRKLKLAAKTVRARAGVPVGVTLTVPKKAQKAIKKARKVRFRVLFVATDAAGNRTESAITVTVKSGKR
jgi:uncharacterized delta-60 repeat protein